MSVVSRSAWTGLQRQGDYYLTVAKRTWRGSLFSFFLSPLLYVLAMGVLLGGFIEGDPSRLEGATSYLAFIVPGLVSAQAMQAAAGEMTYPVMGGLKWHKTYFAQAATPLSVRDIANGHLLFAIARSTVSCAVFLLVLAPFGVFATWWGWCLALLVQPIAASTFAALTMAMSVRVMDEAAFGVFFRMVVMPLVLFSGAFFPIANLGLWGAWVAQLTPLWHAVNLTRMLCVNAVDWTMAGINLAVLVALAVVGWWLAVRGLEKRMEL